MAFPQAEENQLPRVAQARSSCPNDPEKLQGQRVGPNDEQIDKEKKGGDGYKDTKIFAIVLDKQKTNASQERKASQ